MRAGRNVGVSAWPSIQFAQGFRRLAGGIYLHLGANSRRRQREIFSHRVVPYWTSEVFAPLLDRAGLGIDPVEMRLKVAVGTGNIAEFDGEEDVAIIVGPPKLGFRAFILGDATWRSIAGGAIRIDYIDFHVFILLLPLVDCVPDERKLAAVGRRKHVIYTQGTSCNSASSRREIRLRLGFAFFLLCFRGRSLVSIKGCCHVEREDRIAAF